MSKKQEHEPTKAQSSKPEKTTVKRKRLCLALRAGILEHLNPDTLPDELLEHDDSEE